MVADRAELTRLGEGLAETGRIGQAALDRCIHAIAGMAAEAKLHGARTLVAVGTAGLRIASNAAEVIATVRQRTGVQIEVLPGAEEARLAYIATAAALSCRAPGSTVVFETGGGSSQFTFGRAGEVAEQFSVDVGAARYTERFNLQKPVSAAVVEAAMAAIFADLTALDGRPAPDALVAMGGAVTNMTAVSLRLAEYDATRVQGAVLTEEEIDRQIEIYRERDAEARRRIVGLQPARADVILAGACIVRVIMRKLGKSRLTVSDRGLRHGVLLERFGED
jgi:exopolyphosphatase/guanosine-5'-triphosphate,3'-diphosphate pyrophosphatase